LGARSLALPLTVGGISADVVVPGIADGAALRIEQRGEQWWLQPTQALVVTVNGLDAGLGIALVDGDTLRVGDALLTCMPGAATLRVAHLQGNTTIAPLRAEALPGEAVVAGVREIIAAATDPQAANVTAPLHLRARHHPLRRMTLALAGVCVAAALWILFRAVPVTLALTPANARVVASGLFDWRVGDRLFMLPGARVLEVSYAGYAGLRVPVQVQRAAADAAPLRIALQLLPGLVSIDTQGVTSELLVDGRHAGDLPGTAKIAAGPHALIVRAAGHIDFVARIDVQGGGRRQSLRANLLPSYGWLVLDTLPPGARVSVDAVDKGTAPLKLQLDAGLRQLSIASPGRRGWNSEIAIVAGQSLDLGRVNLALPAPMVAKGVSPSDAAGLAGSTVAGTASSGDNAPAAPPAPPPPARIQSAVVGTLLLLPAGKYPQGSDRRDQGRRANEVNRIVTLSRPFYLAQNETTNAQFRLFQPTHVAGVARDKSLDLDPQAVTSVSWNDAVEFCNWLSQREGLPVAYERRDGRWQRVTPFNRGYRLPTEAEWEYAARHVDGQRWARYSWGESLPPPTGAENLAGQESLPAKPGPEVRLASALPDYRDDHAVVAPVGSYAASASGFRDIGGNVSEWMHDVYVSLPDSIAVADPTGAVGDGPHAVRGANWGTAAIADLRLAWRDRAAAAAPTIGFRVTRFATEGP
jgi:formylglycine-generating enzyme required for sulfatase activity